MNKANTVVISTALVIAASSVVYGVLQKKHSEQKVSEAIARTYLKYKHRKDQYTFPHPTKQTLEKFYKGSCEGIANCIESCTYADSDFGNLNREWAVLVLRELADNMKEDEPLSVYFNRNK